MTATFQRFAIYYAPAPDSLLAQAGATWLGWDPTDARASPHPDLGPDLGRVTETPRRYGLHGTLKPPMRLSGSMTEFLDAATRLAKTLAPVPLGPLHLREISGCLALLPDPQPDALSHTCARIVAALDPFRAPLTPSDLARRRSTPLTPRQDALLERWGYPYVMEEFLFHITLSGRLTPPEIEQTSAAARVWFEPALAEPLSLDALAIFAERADGHFQQIHRLPLTG
ncbi:MAG: DUF1045 domain-containing protein [Roseinatronobacter sp.]